MRITNKMMTNSSLTNINKNKLYLDKLNEQLSSKKKISRPSDDPIVAIRALRLRSNLTEITQYYEKNVSDAASWINSTQTAITSTTKVLTSMQAQFTQGANGDNTSASRNAIIEALKNLSDQIRDDGNAQCDGRSLFTGYRTGTDLMFTSDSTVSYQDITEKFNASSISKYTHVSGALDKSTDISGYSTSTATEQQISSNEVSRIRLAYDDLDLPQLNRTKNADGTFSYTQAADLSLTYRTSFNATASNNGTQITIASANLADAVTLVKNASGVLTLDVATPAGYTLTQNKDDTYTLKDASSNVVNITASGKISNAYKEQTMTVNITSISGNQSVIDAAYSPAANDINFIPETGELIIGSTSAATLGALKDIDGVSTIEIAYDKSDWKKNDLRPEHYFNCYDRTNNITYESVNQEICYDVSSNQSMRINTFASEVYTHDIARDIGEIITAMEDANAAQEKVDALTKLKSDSTANQTQVTKLLDAANKELTLSKNKLQKMFESGITSFQGYLKNSTLANTNSGTRTTRLDLVKNRLSELKTTAKELADINENVTISDIAIEVSSAELIYNAALMATGKIAQQSLLNYL